MRYGAIVLATTFPVLLAVFACSGEGRDGAAEPGTTPLELDARLAALVDQRVALALVGHQARRDIRADEARLEIIVEHVGAAIRSRLEEEGGSGVGDQSRQLAELSSRIDGLAGQLKEATRDEAALEDLRSGVRGVLEDARDQDYGTVEAGDWAPSIPAMGAAFTAGGGGSGLETVWQPAGDVRLPFAEVVTDYLDQAMAILDRIYEARAAIETIVTGRLPDSGEYAYDDFGYDDFGYEDWDYDDDWYVADDDGHANDRAEPEDAYPDAFGLGESPVSGDIDPATGTPGAGPVTTHDTYRGLMIELIALRRTEAGTLTLELAVVNGSGDDVALNHVFGGQGGGYWWGLRRVGLIDMASGTRYTVMRDDQGNYLTSAGGHRDRILPPGERLEVWARYAGVPPTVQVVSVDVPGFRLLDGVRVGG